MVEKVPDSTYEMIGGLENQIKEIKEVIELPVKHPELFEALGIAQPKVITKYLINRCKYYFRECCSMDLRGQVRPCWLELLPITRSVHLFVYPVLNSFKSSLERVLEWSGSCSLWPGLRI